MLCSSGDQRPQETKGGRISEWGEGGHILRIPTIVFLGFFKLTTSTTNVSHETVAFVL